MTVKNLMEEYQLEIDDIRWYLSIKMVEQFMTYKDDEKELARVIWSKSLENQLYNMEELFLEDLQDQLDRNLSDDVKIREIFSEADALKRKRNI